MYDINLINFRRLTSSDFQHMYQWLNADFVREWYGKKSWRLKDIEEKYTSYINGQKPIESYLIFYEQEPIGYIQSYIIEDYPDYARAVDINEKASGIDLFIGEENFIHKGLGKYIISKFLKEKVFSLSEIISCILGPEPENKVAIRTYEKVGFKYIKTVQIEDESEYIMRIGRKELESFGDW